MATINQLRRERRGVFRRARRGLRSVDTAIEKTQRFVTAVLARKVKVPESADLLRLLDDINEIYNALLPLVQQLNQDEPLFT